MDRQITGGVAVIEQDGKHLLIKQSKKKPLGGQWRHPGGSFKKGEIPVEGIKRELLEEIGLEIEVLDNEPVHIENIDYGPGYFGFYKAKITGGVFKIDKDEIEDYGWFSPQKIRNLDLMKATKLFYSLH